MYYRSLRMADMRPPFYIGDTVSCNWDELCGQLREQWNALTQRELEATGHSRENIARLIQRKYGIPARLAANYLRNFERTLPLFGCE